ncbi:uncharacterized protein B0I36DRAFT_388692 [Microdochium trichocladiopsis]|uniref:Uncharacterized protein n=1 Tax=Microdochium trichocladiopsis TaxID=1682393 RepID=A0A9P9BJW5_9PEZI|nr:uncharacterized protein B0I36DRAFT_388692 [Microdochium trichocladiopsis]KAH7018495.1 hypothetical protein B0I36DRAFT_388692 [Microdochium trichocladiopsis]
MVAAIALERRGVALDVLLPIAIIRYTNSGPLSLIRFALSPSTLGGFYTCLVSFLFLLTLAAQYSSTLLTYELGPTAVMNFTRSAMVSFRPDRSFTPSSISLAGYTDYYIRRPDSFSIFAEYSEPPQSVADDIDDTGLTIRALLPIKEKTDRERIRLFRGTAKMIDARVTCVRPGIAGLRICGVPLVKTAGYELCGTLRGMDIPHKLWTQLAGPGPGPELEDMDFRCKADNNIYGWSLCRTTGSYFYSFLSGGVSRVVEDSKLTALAMTYLVLDIGAIYWQLRSLNSDPQITNLTQDGALVEYPSWGEGPWTIQRWRWTPFNDSLPSPELQFNATWCAHVAPDEDVGYLNITASVEDHMQEPTFSLDVQSNRFDTRPIREQLGAAGVGSKPRHILGMSREALEASMADIRLRPLASSHPALGDSFLNDQIALRYGENSILLGPLNVGSLPNEAQEDNAQTTDMLLAAIFLDTLNDTKSPARAIQAFRMTQYRIIYQDSLVGYDQNLAQIEIDEEAEVLAPAGKTGYIAVMAIIAAHLAIFFLVLWLFRAQSQSSILEQAWSSVGQVATHPDAQQVLIAASTGKTDDEVAQWIALHKGGGGPEAGGLAPPTSRLRFWRRRGRAAVMSLAGSVRQILTGGGRAEVGGPAPVVRYQIRDGGVVSKVVKNA